MSAQYISRRDFLRKFGIGSAAATASWCFFGSAPAAYASGGAPEQTVGVLIDLTRCTGCNSCALACKESNGLPSANIVPDALASDAFTFVEERWLTTADGTTRPRYVKRQCMHCLNAACVAACPAAAMYKGSEGQVIYRAYRCLGCRFCEAACPFGVPRFDWDNGTAPEINKCWLCRELLRNGQAPACVEACPSGALRFGARERLLVEAHAKIALDPERYVDHVFGEFEVGGTAMLYLSDIPFDQLGFPTGLSHTAPPEQTHKIISKLPFVLTGVTVAMAGTAAYTHRRPETTAQHGENGPQAPPAAWSDELEA